MIEYVGRAQDDRSRWMGWAHWLIDPWGTMGLSYIKKGGKRSVHQDGLTLLVVSFSKAGKHSQRNPHRYATY